MVDTLLNTFGNIFQYFEFHLKKIQIHIFIREIKKKIYKVQVTLQIMLYRELLSQDATMQIERKARNMIK